MSSICHRVPNERECNVQKDPTEIEGQAITLGRLSTSAISQLVGVLVKQDMQRVIGSRLRIRAAECRSVDLLDLFRIRTITAPSAAWAPAMIDRQTA